VYSRSKHDQCRRSGGQQLEQQSRAEQKEPDATRFFLFLFFFFFFFFFFLWLDVRASVRVADSKRREVVAHSVHVAGWRSRGFERLIWDRCVVFFFFFFFWLVFLEATRCVSCCMMCVLCAVVCVGLCGALFACHLRVSEALSCRKKKKKKNSSALVPRSLARSLQTL
jgi:hypothetical protein